MARLRYWHTSGYSIQECPHCLLTEYGGGFGTPNPNQEVECGVVEQVGWPTVFGQYGRCITQFEPLQIQRVNGELHAQIPGRHVVGVKGPMQQLVFGAIRKQWLHVGLHVRFSRHHPGGFRLPAGPPQLLIWPHLAIFEGVVTWLFYANLRRIDPLITAFLRRIIMIIVAKGMILC